MTLARHFDRTNHALPTHTWSLHIHDARRLLQHRMAEALADRIMALRCAGALHHLQSWRVRSAGGPPNDPTATAALTAFVRPVFGLPENPPVPDHLEASVAEHLWYALTQDDAVNDSIVRIEEPSFRTTAPGGDGLVIHRGAAGQLTFRLWEIKKCTGSSTVGATVGVAYRQLDSNAAAMYLAQYTAIGQRETDDQDLAEMYGTLVEQWLTAAPTASAGVSVHTSEHKLPKMCFTTLGTRFPRMTNPVRLRGMLVALGDFNQFAEQVRDFVWTGL